MKLNLDYYELNLANELILSEEDNKILNYISNNEIKDYEKILEEDNTTNVVRALSSNAENCINWYDFKEKSSVLQINGDFGQITGQLCEKCSNVVVIEEEKNKAQAIANRYKNIQNLEIICGIIENIKINKKFDYVILFGTLENIGELSNVEKNFKFLMEFSKKYLKKDGHLLILANNRFGVKKFTGIVDNINEKPYDSILGNTSLYSKRELEEMLNRLNFNNYKFYYMLPDYNLTNVIFSDDYMPDENETKVFYNKYCNERSTFTFDEVSLLKEFIKENKFDFFCNSFFIDVSLNEEENKQKKIKNPKFISFNNMRNKKFQLITKMYDNVVIKEAKNYESIELINQISKNIDLLKKYKFDIIDVCNDNKIYSKYITNITFDKYIINEINKNGLKTLYYNIELWYNYIKEKLQPQKYNDNFKDNIFKKNNISVENELLIEMSFIKDGFVDLVFENTFLNKKEFIFYDQEWYIKNIPIEFILYRAINNLFTYNKSLENIISINKVFEYFNINKYINLFDEFEQIFQKFVMNKNKLLFYGKMCNRKYQNEIDKYKVEVEKLTVLKKNQNKQLKELLISKENQDAEISKLKKELMDLYNSKLWRYTKIFRKK